MPVQLSREIVFRKSIHLVFLIVPLLYLFHFNREQIFYPLVFITIGLIAGELCRRLFPGCRWLFMTVFGPLLKETEREGWLTGATYLAIGMTACVFLFEKNIAVVSMLIVTVSDPLAALVGGYMGRIRIGKKSLEGSVGFFLSAVLIILWLTSLGWWALIVALFLTLVELLPERWNDNLLIPLCAGGMLYLFS